MTHDPTSFASPAPSPRRRRVTCAGCLLPSRTCLCRLVVRVDNAVEVLVLQHPQEAGHAKGTVRLLARCLARCRVVVAETFEPERLRTLLHGGGRHSVLVYPGTPSLPQPQLQHEGREPPVNSPLLQLVVLDGTWRKSLRMLMASPMLRELPRLSLQLEGGRGAYGALRKARLPSQLSTLEATCMALTQVEREPRRYEPVLRAFQEFVRERVETVPRAAGSSDPR